MRIERMDASRSPGDPTVADESKGPRTEGAALEPVEPAVRIVESQATPVPYIRSLIGGVLMGLANLVPGVSGGTMIVLMGLYDEFVGALADVTRLKLTRRHLSFLGVVGGAAVVTIVALAKPVSILVSDHRSAMYSLFVGMTLGGAPVLTRMLGRWSPRAAMGLMIGLAVMITIAITRPEPPEREAVRAAVAEGRFDIEPNYALDVSAGMVGMSAMVLPGISGAYMLLILGRYEVLLAAVSAAKSYALDAGRSGDLGCLHVLVPAAFGALIGVVLLSNILKWMLRRQRDLILGVLIGILLGSVVGIWPFQADSHDAAYVVGVALALAGFVATLLLSKVGARGDSRTRIGDTGPGPAHTKPLVYKDFR